MTALDVRVFVQTRGTARATDYAFLGGAPPEPWWRAYRDATAFDHPTVLVASDGAGWAAYLSGIPSTRVDAVGTVVRYTLVVDGPCGAADAACVPAAVAAWLDDVAAGHGDRPGGRLAAALDARFPPDDVRAVAGPGSDGRRGALVRYPLHRPRTRCAGARWPRCASLPGPADCDGRARRLGRRGRGPRTAGRVHGPRRRTRRRRTRAGPASSTSSVGRPTPSRCSTPPPPSPCSSRARTPGWRGAPRFARWWRQKKRRPPRARRGGRGPRQSRGLAVLPAAAVIGVLVMTVLVVTLLVWLL